MGQTHGKLNTLFYKKLETTSSSKTFLNFHGFVVPKISYQFLSPKFIKISLLLLQNLSKFLSSITAIWGSNTLIKGINFQRDQISRQKFGSSKRTIFSIDMFLNSFYTNIFVQKVPFLGQNFPKYVVVRGTTIWDGRVLSFQSQQGFQELPQFHLPTTCHLWYIIQEQLSQQLVQNFSS